MMLSHYFYAKQLTVKGTNFRNGQPHPINLDDVNQYIELCDCPIVNYLPAGIDTDNLIDILDQQFIFIGLAEDLNHSCARLAAVLDKPVMNVPLVNVSTRDEVISRDAKRRFRERNELAFALYEYAWMLNKGRIGRARRLRSGECKPMINVDPLAAEPHEVFVAHLGWLSHAADEEVARSLNEGGFEYREQAFFWLYLREGAVVIDCGAHIGLFSVLAGGLVGPQGRVIAVEPHPETSLLLERNLAAHGVASAHVVRAAVADRSGVAELTLGTTGRAAYSSLLSVQGAAERVDVPTLTLDDLAAAHEIGTVDLLKLDVEGMEIAALAGARQLLAERRVQALLIEFTEENLARGGHSTASLRDAIIDAGYALYRFNEAELALEPTTVTAPITYENLFAVHGSADWINARLRETPVARRRVAEQIIRRGRACEKLRTARSRVVDALREVERRDTKILEQNQQIALQEQQIVLQEQKIELKKQQIGVLTKRLADLQIDITELRQEHRHIKSSRSWRYTRPFRSLTDVAVKLTRKQMKTLD